MAKRPKKLRYRAATKIGGAVHPLGINGEAYTKTSAREDLVDGQHAQLEYNTMWTDRVKYFRETECFVPHGNRNANKVRKLGIAKLQPPSKAGLKK